MVKQAFDIKKVREDLEKMSSEEFVKNHTIEEVTKLRAQIKNTDKVLKERVSKAFMLMRAR